MEHIIQFLVENYGAFGILLLAVSGMSYLIIKELKKSNQALIQKQAEINNNSTNAIVSSLSNFANSVAQDLRDQNKDLIKKQSEFNSETTNTIVKSLSELSNSLTNDLREQNKQLIEHLIQNKENERTRHNENLISRKNVTIEINNIINDLRIGLSAQRISILEFHNSFANQTGFPFLKFTVTYEKFSKGCIPLQNTYQGVQFGSISEICECVLKSDNHICVLKSKEEIYDIVPIMLINDRAVNGAIFKGIFDIEDNMLIGLMCIEFSDKIPYDFDEISIITSARTIGELITLSNSTTPIL